MLLAQAADDDGAGGRPTAGAAQTCCHALGEVRLP